MTPAPALAQIILAIHVVVIAFNVLGLAVIPLGAWLRWGFVRWMWLRLLHLALLAVVAAQATAGRACFLTIWQGDLEGGGAETPLLAGLVNRLIYWPLPLWVFTALYVAVFAYVLALMWLVPPRRRLSPAA